MRLIWALLANCILLLPAAAENVRVCERRPRVTPELTCLFDGDSGWQRGTHWHLAEVDAPEIDAPDADCRREQMLGLRALERLRQLMSRGYTVVYLAKRDGSGRQLAKIQISDGRDAGTELMSAGLAEALPNTGERWCRP
jgi:endonuclease YncB( thermonuclease family)